MVNFPGGMELVVIVLVVLLLFGGKKIPELARGVGKGIREFKEGMKEVNDDVKKELKDKDVQEKQEKD